MSRAWRFILSRGHRPVQWLWVSAAVIAFDQLTKLWISYHLGLFDVEQILPFFNLTLLHNQGAAFSMLSHASGWQRWFFIALGIAVSLGIMAWLRRLPASGQALLSSGLALILGGALGNVLDRVWRGYVVDFIQVHYGHWTFPAFNLADSAITIGAALVILDSLLNKADQDSESAGAGQA